MVENKEIIEPFKDLFKDKNERNKILCYVLLTKNDDEFDTCKKTLKKILED